MFCCYVFVHTQKELNNIQNNNNVDCFLVFHMGGKDCWTKIV